jgi:hypothetical protein
LKRVFFVKFALIKGEYIDCFDEDNINVAENDTGFHPFPCSRFLLEPGGCLKTGKREFTLNSGGQWKLRRGNDEGKVDTPH